MGEIEERYLEALQRLSLARVAQATGRGYSTLQAYRLRTRRVTREAADELLEYLRTRSDELTAAADALAAAMEREGSS